MSIISNIIFLFYYFAKCYFNYFNCNKYIDKMEKGIGKEHNIWINGNSHCHFFLGTISGTWRCFHQ